MGDDFGEAIREVVELSAGCPDGKRTTVHFEYVLSGDKRINYAFDARADTAQRCCWLGYKVSRSGAGELELPLEVRHRDIQISHRHLWAGMTEQLHQDRKTNTRSEHFCRIGVPAIPDPE